MTQIYQIRVRGRLSDVWTEWFDGLTIEDLPNGEALSGPVVDRRPCTLTKVSLALSCRCYC